jgi:hypothetical protein
VRGGTGAALALRSRDEAARSSAPVGASGASAFATSLVHRGARAALSVRRGDVPTRTRAPIGAAATAFTHVDLLKPKAGVAKISKPSSVI